MYKKCLGLVVAALILMVSVSVMAAPVNFDMGTGSYVDTNGTSSGLFMWTNVYDEVANEAFLLSEGESYSFLYAMIGTTESSVNADDLNPQGVTAYLDFDMPMDSNQTVNGITVGTSSNWNFNQGWTATWTPSTASLSDGTIFTVTLSDTSFESGWWQGPDGACGNAFANIYATVTLDQEPVPEPATMILFGTGLMGLVGVGRSRKSKKKLV